MWYALQFINKIMKILSCGLRITKNHLFATKFVFNLLFARNNRKNDNFKRIIQSANEEIFTTAQHTETKRTKLLNFLWSSVFYICAPQLPPLPLPFSFITFDYSFHFPSLLHFVWRWKITAYGKSSRNKISLFCFINLMTSMLNRPVA